MVEHSKRRSLKVLGTEKKFRLMESPFLLMNEGWGWQVILGSVRRKYCFASSDGELSFLTVSWLSSLSALLRTCVMYRQAVITACPTNQQLLMENQEVIWVGRSVHSVAPSARIAADCKELKSPQQRRYRSRTHPALLICARLAHSCTLFTLQNCHTTTTLSTLDRTSSSTSAHPTWPIKTHRSTWTKSSEYKQSAWLFFSAKL